MGYALFAQRKLVLDSQLNSLQLQQTQRSNEQYKLATDTLSLQQQLGSLQAAQSSELSTLYEKLAQETDSGLRGSIQATIEGKELDFKKEQDNINRKIYLTGVKENTIEMEVKHLDTQVAAIEKQLDAVQEAEGAAVDRATPKFKAQG